MKVALDSKTSSVLKTLGLGAEMVGVLLTTAAFTPGTEGKKGKTMFLPPDHAESRIMIGVEATHLLQVGRRGPLLRLSLGRPPGCRSPWRRRAQRPPDMH